MERHVVRRSMLIVTVMLALIMAAPVQGLSDDQDRTQERLKGGQHLDDPAQLQVRLRTQIQQDTELSDAQVDEIAPYLGRMLRANGGETEPLRAMVREAVGDGCIDTCLTQRLRAQLQTMVQEQQNLEAARMETGRQRNRETNRTRSDSDGDGSGQSGTGDRTRSGRGSGAANRR